MSEGYVNPLTERYASAEMSAVFSPRFKFETWRRLWLWLAEEERRLGLPIPEEAIAQMGAHLSDVDFQAAAAEEAKTRHDVMAHVHVFGAAAPAAKGIIHWGATSAYVTDNTDLIQMREGLALVERRLVATLRKLRAFALAHRDLPALAYTHFQPGQPTTVGKRATLWASDLLMDLEEVRAVGAGPALSRRQGRDRHPGLLPAPLRAATRPRSRSSTARWRPARASPAGSSCRARPTRASRTTASSTRSRAWRSPPTRSARTCACSSTRASSRSRSRSRRSAPPRCRTSETRCGPSASARSRAT